MVMFSNSASYSKGEGVVAKPENAGKPWTPPQVKQLRGLAADNTPTRVIGLLMGRTESSIQSKAAAEGVSLKPTNQSPYNRRK